MSRFKIGDRVELLCQFSHGTKGTILEILPETFSHPKRIRIKRDPESGEGLWFYEHELKLIQDGEDMSKIGKKFKSIYSATFIVKVVYQDEGGYLVKCDRNDQKVYYNKTAFENYFKEYKEPKIYTKTLYVKTCDHTVRLTNRNIHSLWVSGDSFTGPNDVLRGKIELTYTEGSGLSVEILEGGCTKKS